MHRQVSVSQITILLLYLLAAMAFAISRLPNYGAHSRLFLAAALALVATGIGLHAHALHAIIGRADTLNLSISNAVSLIGLQLALIGLLAAIEPTLRGMTAGLLRPGPLTVWPWPGRFARIF
jgi:ABC-type uncharacterized transport system permease subunit